MALTGSETIVVVGLWHQGVVAAGILAELGFRVIGCDRDAQRIENLAVGRSPLFEPGLDDLIATQVRKGGLRFSTDIQGATRESSVVFLSHDTAVRDDDTSDLSEVDQCVVDIASEFTKEKLLWVTAQVPVGSCDRFVRVIADIQKISTDDIQLVYSPENLRLGRALELFRSPALPVIGARSQAEFNRARNLLEDLSSEWQWVSLRTAEMVKHALNSFLAMSVTFGNELGQICEAVGADGRELAKALRREPRIGPNAPLMPGLGFSGGTLARDVRTLLDVANATDLPVPLLNGVWRSNTEQLDLLPRRLERFLGKKVAGLTITVLGLTYKPDTSTLRRSASVEFIGKLLDLGARVRSHDPRADPQERDSQRVGDFFEDPILAAEGSDAVVLFTPWQTYKDLDLQLLGKHMKSKVLFDTAGIWSSLDLKPYGFRYMTLGQGII